MACDAMTMGAGEYSQMRQHVNSEFEQIYKCYQKAHGEYKLNAREFLERIGEHKRDISAAGDSETLDYNLKLAKANYDEMAHKYHSVSLDTALDYINARLTGVAAEDVDISFQADGATVRIREAAAKETRQ